MTAIRLLARVAPLAGFCALLACTPKQEAAAPAAAAATAASQDSVEFDWMRSALSKNPQLQVLAADPESHVITVRIKKTGEVRALKLNEIAAAPIADLAAAEQSPPPPPEPVAAATPAPEPAPTPPPAATPSRDPTAGYTIQREAGKVKVSGPGVSIESASASSSTPRAGSSRRVEPIVCDGQRAMYVDGETVSADGDAVIARNGCELHIANSNIEGTTNGILIENASVHVRNSTVEGGQASFQSVGSAKLYLQNSTFRGASRRSEKTQIDDQGGNIWR
jgi:hypothetical protein